MEAVKESGWTSRPTTRVTVGGMDGCCTGQDVLVSRWTETGQATTCTQVCGAVPNVGAFRRCSIRRNGVLSSKRYQRATPEVPPVCLAKTDRPKGVPVSVHPAIAARVLPGPHTNLIPSPIPEAPSQVGVRTARGHSTRLSNPPPPSHLCNPCNLWTTFLPVSLKSVALLEP